MGFHGYIFSQATLRFSTITVDPHGYAVGQICLWILSGFWGNWTLKWSWKTRTSRRMSALKLHCSPCFGKDRVLLIPRCSAFPLPELFQILWIGSQSQAVYMQGGQQITLHVVRCTHPVYKFRQGTALPIILWASPMATKFPTISCGNKTCWRRRFRCCPCESSQSWKAILTKNKAMNRGSLNMDDQESVSTNKYKTRADSMWNSKGIGNFFPKLQPGTCQVCSTQIKLPPGNICFQIQDPRLYHPILFHQDAPWLKNDPFVKGPPRTPGRLRIDEPLCKIKDIWPRLSSLTTMHPWLH